MNLALAMAAGVALVAAVAVGTEAGRRLRPRPGHRATVLGLFPSLEQAVYFALVAFTTLGYGDVLLPKEWQLLGGMAAANGLLNFGLLIAVLLAILIYLAFAKQLPWSSPGFELHATFKNATTLRASSPSTFTISE